MSDKNDDVPAPVQRAIDVMAKQLEEFFSAFHLVGYCDETGNRVRISFTPTAKDADAVQQHLEDSLIQDFKVSEFVKIEPEGDSYG